MATATAERPTTKAHSKGDRIEVKKQRVKEKKGKLSFVGKPAHAKVVSAFDGDFRTKFEKSVNDLARYWNTSHKREDGEPWTAKEVAVKLVGDLLERIIGPDGEKHDWRYVKAVAVKKDSVELTEKETASITAYHYNAEKDAYERYTFDIKGLVALTGEFIITVGSERGSDRTYNKTAFARYVGKSYWQHAAVDSDQPRE